MRRPYRKPLVVMAPKKLLKFRAASSELDEFKTGLRFKRVLEDTNDNLVADEDVRKVVYCSGQVYYDLDAARKKRGIDDIAIIRIEQIAPFPFRSTRTDHPATAVGPRSQRPDSRPRVPGTIGAGRAFREPGARSALCNGP